MSIEAHVFTSESQSIPNSELAPDLALVNIAAQVIRNFQDWSNFDVVSEENLQDGDIVCGWFLRDSAASQIENAITMRDRKTIEELLLQGDLGSCNIGISDLASVPPADRPNLAEVDGDRVFAESMAISKLDYNAYTSAGRNDLSILLQFRLTQVIAKLRGGVWTDPVSGDYLVVKKGRWERLPCLVEFEQHNPQ